MSVEEIIDRIGKLTPDELRQVKAVVDQLAAVRPEPTAEQLARGLAIWKQMEEGLIEGTRTDLSQNIDEALYGRED